MMQVVCHPNTRHPELNSNNTTHARATNKGQATRVQKADGREGMSSMARVLGGWPSPG